MKNFEQFYKTTIHHHSLNTTNEQINYYSASD